MDLLSASARFFIEYRVIPCIIIAEKRLEIQYLQGFCNHSADPKYMMPTRSEIFGPGRNLILLAIPREADWLNS